VTENTPLKVWVLIVDHKHGTNVTAHPTREAAESANRDYCDEWWDREFGAETRPSGDQIAAEYWRRMSERGEEWHLIEECELKGVPQPVPDGKNEERRTRLIESIGRRFALLVSNDRMPHMSGDPRMRIPSHKRSMFDEAVADVADLVLMAAGPERYPATMAFHRRDTESGD
jgi:hypothetical protein